MPSVCSRQKKWSASALRKWVENTTEGGTIMCARQNKQEHSNTIKKYAVSRYMQRQTRKSEAYVAGMCKTEMPAAAVMTMVQSALHTAAKAWCTFQPSTPMSLRGKALKATKVPATVAADPTRKATSRRPVSLNTRLYCRPEWHTSCHAGCENKGLLE